MERGAVTISLKRVQDKKIYSLNDIRCHFTPDKAQEHPAVFSEKVLRPPTKGEMRILLIFIFLP